ncbi:hypothetical protein [Streptococcus plurextorum]|uniref:hypothetical protein n=1 Tax=Streptococcus plurextorum TaxID=456876 RepID=UPI00042676D7|nr:hypothetical protein [Streptococcus plurextorum]
MGKLKEGRQTGWFMKKKGKHFIFGCSLLMLGVASSVSADTDFATTANLTRQDTEQPSAPTSSSEDMQDATENHASMATEESTSHLSTSASSEGSATETASESATSSTVSPNSDRQESQVNPLELKVKLVDKLIELSPVINQAASDLVMTVSIPNADGTTAEEVIHYEEDGWIGQPSFYTVAKSGLLTFEIDRIRIYPKIIVKLSSATLKRKAEAWILTENLPKFEQDSLSTDSTLNSQSTQETTDSTSNSQSTQDTALSQNSLETSEQSETSSSQSSASSESMTGVLPPSPSVTDMMVTMPSVGSVLGQGESLVNQSLPVTLETNFSDFGLPTVEDPFVGFSPQISVPPQLIPSIKVFQVSTKLDKDGFLRLTIPEKTDTFTLSYTTAKGKKKTITLVRLPSGEWQSDADFITINAQGEVTIDSKKLPKDVTMSLKAKDGEETLDAKTISIYRVPKAPQLDFSRGSMLINPDQDTVKWEVSYQVADGAPVVAEVLKDSRGLWHSKALGVFVAQNSGLSFFYPSVLKTIDTITLTATASNGQVSGQLTVQRQDDSFEIVSQETEEQTVLVDH